MQPREDPMSTGSPSTRGMELPPLRDPETIARPGSYLSSAGVTVMTSAELADARHDAAPPAPGFSRFGDRGSHMTDRFLLSGNFQGYRIFRVQSAARPVEFPLTEQGWARAWTAFRTMDGQAG